MNKQTSYERLALLAAFSSIFYFNAGLFLNAITLLNAKNPRIIFTSYFQSIIFYWVKYLSIFKAIHCYLSIIPITNSNELRHLLTPKLLLPKAIFSFS